ncbi:generic methyl-transferase [Luminiphilus syltensis NOR5-1B]|uniref:Generic methyl-transferase n=1 Tax=Luminiphilus syltensis NOR5-1B TaxID=565045 RepID=B8KSC8_9GAMM|nr:generic methyl-transferase [Luminiphilus syltensis NOR5-1B]
MDDLSIALDELFGYHMVLLGTDPAIDIPSMTRVQQVIRSRPGAGPVGTGALSVYALDEELPFETESVDVVVALHALDVSEDPHQALREIRRVLTPHGHLILVGMNPRSLLGGLRRLQSARSQSPWRGISPVSPHKAQDWLSLLDFNSDHARHKLVVPTSTRGRLRGVLQRLDERLVRHNVPLGSAT